MFISKAFAQAGGPAGGGDMLIQLLPFVLIIVVFYLLLFRPQQRRMKEHRDMLAAIRRGDRVVTGGGIIGTVAKVGADDELSVDIAEGVRVKVVRSTITSVLAKGVPAKSGAPPRADGSDDADEPALDATVEPGARPEPQRGSIGRFLSRK